MNNSKLNLLHIFFNLLIIKDSYQINYKKVCSKLLWQYGKLQCQNQHRVFKMFKTSHLGIIKMNYNCLSKEWRYKICLLHVFITKIIKPVMKFIITDHCNEIMQYPLSMKVDVDILFYKISSVKIICTNRWKCYYSKLILLSATLHHSTGKYFLTVDKLFLKYTDFPPLSQCKVLQLSLSHSQQATLIE